MLAHGLLLAVVLVWGTTFVLIKAALQDCTPLLFNQIRMLLAAALLLFVNGREVLRARGRVWTGGVLAGCLLALGYELQTAGLARTTAAKNALLTGTVVVLVPLFALLAAAITRSKAKVRWPVLVSAALSFFGIALLTTPAGTTLQSLRGAIQFGDVLSLLCAVGFAAHLLTLAHFSKGSSAAVLVTVQIGAAALAMSIATPLLERAHAHVTGLLVTTWVLTACFATAAAFWIQTWAQKHMPPTHVAVMLALEPAFAWVTSLMFLGERLGSRGAVGAGLILGGLLLGELAPGGTPVPEQPEAGLHVAEGGA